MSRLRRSRLIVLEEADWGVEEEEALSCTL